MMYNEHTLALKCCGKRHSFKINDRAILSGDLNECRRNVVCDQCDQLVILELSHENGQIVAQQEVVEP
jgi:hypothetical protein